MFSTWSLPTTPFRIQRPWISEPPTTVALVFLSRRRSGLPRAPEAPERHRGEAERDQHIVAGEREAEETPRRLVAAHQRGGLHLLEQAAGGAEARDLAGAVRRASPPLPLDAGVIDAEPGVPEH